MSNDTAHADSGAYVRRLVELDKSTLPPDGGGSFNRLIFSSSPYLLQHAENPVDWYEWGDEAFAEARRADKPVFLSIGYATCHWCHVMARESFEDREVAAVLNRNFVAIKVDREERPDIDDAYMTVSRLMTGSGGWPLNVFLTPEREPFLTATYLPRTKRMGMPGLIELLGNIADLWQTRRDMVERNCIQVMAELRRASAAEPGTPEAGDLASAAFRQLEAMYDAQWGGFGGAPKFPMPTYISFLTRHGEKSGDPRATRMAAATLASMRCGGIFDQVGFGFHRYSVDRQWLVPHFEKMLYDQALLALNYCEGFQATGEPFFRTVAEEIFTFVLRELTSPDGGFYSALDADSEGAEGTYYLWMVAQVQEVLGEQEAEEYCRSYGITLQGNFEGSNIPHLPMPDRRGDHGLPELPRTRLGDARERLLEAREKRIRPLRDEKVLTAWNGLMISALAKGFMVTGRTEYRAAAEKGGHFILRQLQNAEGRLLRSSHQGKSGGPGFLEDYAFFVQGLTGLYEATLEQEWLDHALRLSRDMLRLFDDPVAGGLFDAGVDAETVLVRAKSADDGVTPSANAVAAMNLLRLGRIAGDEVLATAGERLLRAFMGTVAKQPAACLSLLAALDFFSGSPVEITLAGSVDAPETASMIRVIGQRFIPDLVLRMSPGEAGFNAVTGKTIAHVCAAGACRPPVSSAQDLGELLDALHHA